MCTHMSNPSPKQPISHLSQEEQIERAAIPNSRTRAESLMSKE